MTRRVVIVGGVAGGASAAARLRRLDEECEIVLFDELCYAPQFGAAKDPVNVAGMMAANVLRGDMPLADWSRLSQTTAALLDVREPDEFVRGHLPGAVNLPLSELRRRLHEVPRGRELWVYCAAGQRAYFAQRLLRQLGHDAKNLSGGFTTYTMMREAGLLP
jgi:rhodanese-related sulfurtransferase